MPSHDLTRFHALLPLLIVLAVLNPPAAQALATALGIVLSLQQLH